MKRRNGTYYINVLSVINVNFGQINDADKIASSDKGMDV